MINRPFAQSYPHATPVKIVSILWQSDFGGIRIEDVLTQITRLKRPTLLVRTARHGIEDYNRLIHLRRLLKTDNLPSPGKAVVKLMELETILNDQRSTINDQRSTRR